MAEIYFATNRNVKHETSKTGKNFGDRFNAHGPQCFRVGSVEVTLKGDPKNDAKWKVGQSKLFPEKLASDSPKGALLGSKAMFERLRGRLKKTDCDLLIYLHGFANDFPNSVRRAAALQHLYSSEAKPLPVVMFSWPSNGKVFPSYNYFSDREDAEVSGVAMARALQRFAEFLKDLRAADLKVLTEARRRGEVATDDDLKQCERKIHLVAHSMGNWALRHALVKFTDLHPGRLPRMFDHAFLMAADADADALEHKHKLECLLQVANMVHVYHARDDQALEISDTTKGNPNRLGADGLANLDILDERVVAIDCQDVSETILSHGRHQYYRLRDEVIGDVIQTVQGAGQQGRKGRIEVRPGRSWRLKAT